MSVVVHGVSPCVGNTRDNGCADNVKGLVWGGAGSAEGLQLLLEVAGHALDLRFPVNVLV